MNFLKFKFRILPILLCLTFYGVKSLTEEELAPILQQFKVQLFQEWERKLSVATRDLPDMVTAIQGTKVIYGQLSIQVPH